jgi:hypothetical protein
VAGLNLLRLHTLISGGLLTVILQGILCLGFGSTLYKRHSSWRHGEMLVASRMFQHIYVHVWPDHFLHTPLLELGPSVLRMCVRLTLADYYPASSTVIEDDLVSHAGWLYTRTWGVGSNKGKE